LCALLDPSAMRSSRRPTPHFTLARRFLVTPAPPDDTPLNSRLSATGSAGTSPGGFLNQRQAVSTADLRSRFWMSSSGAPTSQSSATASVDTLFCSFTMVIYDPLLNWFSVGKHALPISLFSGIHTTIESPGLNGDVFPRFLKIFRTLSRDSRPDPPAECAIAANFRRVQFLSADQAPHYVGTRTEIAGHLGHRERRSARNVRGWGRTAFASFHRQRSSLACRGDLVVTQVCITVLWNGRPPRPTRTRTKPACQQRRRMPLNGLLERGHEPAPWPSQCGDRAASRRQGLRSRPSDRFSVCLHRCRMPACDGDPSQSRPPRPLPWTPPSGAVFFCASFVTSK
jgi:hypothetical protein